MKAEEEANKRYCVTRGDDTEETSGIDMQRASDFIDGYHQAEKDMELTWEDMQLIGEIQFSICYYEYKDKRLPPREQIYKEVLKRFNKERKEK